MARVGRAPAAGPAGLVYAVGDVHGCLDLYREIEARIVADAAGFDGPRRILLLGDVVDRGPQTAALLDHLIAPPPPGFHRDCVMGNHEAMMLRFLHRPGRNRAWLEMGGEATLRSYGMRPDPVRGFDLPERMLRMMIAAHVPQEHLAWLSARPASILIGPWAFLHDPLHRVPEGRIVVHGHRAVTQARQSGRRIAVDTAAYATGLLSAMRLEEGHPPEVLSVTMRGEAHARA